jgi:hypothetical protein
LVPRRRPGAATPHQPGTPECMAMPTRPRSFAATLVATACLVAGAYALPRASARLGVDLWADPGDMRRLEQERSREAELLAELAGVRERYAVKRRLAGELLAGRLTVPQAGARFRAIDRARPDFKWDCFRARYPGATDDERHCRQAIDVARDLAGATPDHLRALEAEFEAMLVRGDLQLPEPIVPR